MEVATAAKLKLLRSGKGTAGPDLGLAWARGWVKGTDEGTGSFWASQASQGALPSHVLLPVLLSKATFLDLVTEKPWTRFKKFLKGPKRRGWAAVIVPSLPSTLLPRLLLPLKPNGGAVRRTVT